MTSYRVADLTTATGINPGTISYWHKIGLIETRPAGGHRLVDRRDARRILALAHVDGRSCDLQALVEELDRHSRGVLVAWPDGIVLAGDGRSADSWAPDVAGCQVVDLNGLAATLARLADRRLVG